MRQKVSTFLAILIGIFALLLSIIFAILQSTG